MGKSYINGVKKRPPFLANRTWLTICVLSVQDTSWSVTLFEGDISNLCIVCIENIHTKTKYPVHVLTNNFSFSFHKL